MMSPWVWRTACRKPGFATCRCRNTPAAPQPVEEVSVPHVEATPTPVQPSPPVDTGLDNLMQSKPLVNESAPQSNE